MMFHAKVYLTSNQHVLFPLRFKSLTSKKEDKMDKQKHTLPSPTYQSKTTFTQEEEYRSVSIQDWETCTRFWDESHNREMILSQYTHKKMTIRFPFSINGQDKQEREKKSTFLKTITLDSTSLRE